jgi:hypothetical protein
MGPAFATSLYVNKERIALNEFAHNYVTNIVLCAVSMLKGGSGVKTLVFSLEGNIPSLVVNDLPVPLISYPREALSETFKGVALSLHGISTVNSLRIEVRPA